MKYSKCYSFLRKSQLNGKEIYEKQNAAKLILLLISYGLRSLFIELFLKEFLLRIFTVYTYREFFKTIDTLFPIIHRLPLDYQGRGISEKDNSLMLKCIPRVPLTDMHPSNTWASDPKMEWLQQTIVS